MKQFNIFKKLLIVALLCGSYISNAQNIHPKAFGFIGTSAYSNWYVDYVSTRFAVTSPASVAGDKLYSKADSLSGWTLVNKGYRKLPLINVPIVMGPVNDTDGCAAFAAGSMTGKIALIWRGTCEFGFKAVNAQNAGAVAVVIVNNQPGGLPVGMGAGAVGASDTIPTFMISNADGLAISAAYAGGAGTVTMTISQWGQNLDNDLGFIPGGIASWQNFATPSNQVVSSGNPVAMQGIEGAFVANYGNKLSTNVNLAANTTFTPTGGSPASIHSASITLTTPFDNTNPAADSIWAMFMPSYNLTGITGNGRLNIKYTLTSDSTDDNPSNDTISANVYFTDSLYSKGRYDFANNRPYANSYNSASLPTDGSESFYIWGNMYYVNKGGTAADRAQFTISSNTDTNGTIATLTEVYVYLFKWVEGMNGQNVDSFVQNGELLLVGLGVKSFTGADGDTSGGMFTVAFHDSNGVGGQPFLDASSWYYVAPEVPGGTNVWFLGNDGYNNAYPRVYGRWQNNFPEYSSPVWPSGRTVGANAQVNTFTSTMAVLPFGGSFDVDSMIYDNVKGLIPAVPLWVNNHPNKVTNVTQDFAKFDLYPNPASDKINVSVGLDNSAKAVTYTVINTAGRVISKEIHNNVKDDKFSYNTANLPSGNYFMIVVADGKQMFKKFTVLR